MSFVSRDVLSKLPSMTERDLDALGFGVVGLTDEGRILKYNKYQSEMANVARSHAIGKLFFKEIAPCTQSGLFSQQFKVGIESGTLDRAFPYTFNYKMKPTNVHVHLYRDPGTRTNWVLVKMM